MMLAVAKAAADQRSHVDNLVERVDSGEPGGEGQRQKEREQDLYAG